MEGLLVLPQDINITPVAELPANVREQIQAEEGDYAITRPRSRTPSKVIDAQTLALLKEFDKPKSIIDAVLDISKTFRIPASQLLDDAFPVLQAFYSQKLLVDADSDDGERIKPSFEKGDRVGEICVAECVQVLADSEIYRVTLDNGGDAALKITRKGASSQTHKMIRREAQILRHLNGAAAPRLLRVGTTEDGRIYLLLEWCPGVDALTAVGDMRTNYGDEALPRILDLCARILDAYAELHAQGIIHSDVHARNLQIADGNVKLLDFGLARIPEDQSLSSAPIGGVPALYTPEFAGAILEDAPPPPSTFEGEQYSLAALLYSLIAGKPYLDFSVVRDELARQITSDEPVSLQRRGIAGADHVDAVLRKALCKSPALRFASMADFAAEFRSAAGMVNQPEPESAPAVAPTRSADFDGFFSSVIAQLQDPRRDVSARGLVAPSMSVTYGKAGIAHALHRISAAKGDAKMLALADLWAEEAAHQAAREDAFYSESIQITPAIVGRVSPYHTASGIPCVQALIANAMGDGLAMERAIQEFVNATSNSCDNIDLTLGTSSIVITLALLVDCILSSGARKPEALIAYGDAVVRDIWEKLDRQPAIPESRDYEYLGIAHGWAGFCYAALRWSLASGSPLHATVQERLRQLSACAELTRRGVRWPWRSVNGGQMLPGWCNGVAGHVFLWTLAHRMLGNSEYLDLAERSATEAARMEAGLHTLCCGSAGQAYALLSLYKHTRDKRWLNAAEAQASQAVQSAQHARSGTGQDIPFSLYKGEIGVAVLVADLQRPEVAAMPFFEEERWHA